MALTLWIKLLLRCFAGKESSSDDIDENFEKDIPPLARFNKVPLA